MSDSPALVTSETGRSLENTPELVDVPDDNVLDVEHSGDEQLERAMQGHDDYEDDDTDNKANRSGEDGDSDNNHGNRHTSRQKVLISHGDASPQRTVPKVRRTGLEGFMSFFSEDESSCAIDVLEAGYSIKEDIARERANRGGTSGASGSTGPKVANITSMQRKGITTDEVWIQRVRIKSRHILAILRTVMHSSIKWDQPRTFMRPFHAFIHYQPRVKERLEEMRAALTDKSTGSQSPAGDATGVRGRYQRAHGKRRRGRMSVERRRQTGAPSVSSSDVDSDSDIRSGSDDAGDDDIPEELLRGQEAVDHLQCYVDFVDKNIMILPDAYKGTTKQRIRYSDLAYLFHPGDVVYSTQKYRSETANNTTAKEQPQVYQPIWKIQYTNPPSINSTNTAEFDKNHRFYISCFYIDFDGKDYGPVKYRFDIQAYEGEYDIKDLPLYPIRYLSSFSKGIGSQELDRLSAGGRNFQDFVEAKHLYYRGWTLTTSPNGEVLTNSDGEPMKHPEHIDSNVIVDFKATFQALPSWKPTFREPSRMDEEWTTSTDDKFPVVHYTDRKRTKIVRRLYDTVQLRDGAHAIETNSYAHKDDFFLAYLEGNTGIGYQLSEENLQLLPDRVMAYVLRDRKFVQLDVRYLSKIEQQSNVFDNLKIDDRHKQMVMALVDSHFHRKAVRGPRYFSPGQDLIQGKGEGLVILLHGVPGVGKTATAEAVAQSYQHPLFVITCGDLGFTPKEVERSLEEIFRLAHLWDCVLLLDEADIFLAERTRDDLKRNALVSVFLRVLEYYSGILFLTTNRVGTLDEAFKSRIHMSLYYPPLSRSQTRQIFEMNIKRIEEINQRQHHSAAGAAESKQETAKEKASPEEGDPNKVSSKGHKPEVVDIATALDLEVDSRSVMEFAEAHFENNPAGRWNGRQIRNAFQIASSLAFYDERQVWMKKKSQGDKSARLGRAVLNRDHFERVAYATLRFEKYMTDARGMDAKGLARVDRIRADDHVVDDYEPRFADWDWTAQARRQARRSNYDDYRYQYPAQTGPMPRTPQSGRYGAGDGIRRRDQDWGYDTRNDNDRGWSTAGSERERYRDQEYDRGDRPRHRDYDRASAMPRGGYGQDDYYPPRRGGGDNEVPGPARPNNRGYDQDRFEDRNDVHRDRDDRPHSSARSRGGGGGGGGGSGGSGGSGDFDGRRSSRNHTPTRPPPPRGNPGYYDDTPSRGPARDASPSRGRSHGLEPGDEHDQSTRVR